MVSGVAHDMHRSSRNVEAVAGAQGSRLATERDDQGSGEHLDTLVLADMEVTRNASAGIQTDVDTQERAGGLAGSFEKRQMLAGARVVKVLASGSG